MPQIQKVVLINLLKSVMPDIHEELETMDKNGGWIKLEDKFVDLLIQWKFNWWQYYENEQLLKAIGLSLFLDTDEAKKLYENTPMDEIYQEYVQLLETVDDIPIPAEGEQKQFWDNFSTLSEEDKIKQLKPFCKLVLSIITVSFNYLALMVHKKSMCQLVIDAKNGDDQAYCDAVQIDRSVLRLDHFQDRLIRAQFSGDQNFLDKLSYRFRAPLLQTRVRYKTLLLAFAILDDEGFLSELPHDELLDICEQIGVYGKAFGVEDVGHLRKRLSDYYKM